MGVLASPSNRLLLVEMAKDVKVPGTESRGKRGLSPFSHFLEEAAMKFWPSDSFVVKTQMSPEDIVKKMDSVVEKRSGFHWPGRTKRFRGEVSQDGFKIRRIIYYRNLSRPVVRGEFLPREQGTEVVVRMDLSWLANVMMTLWLIFACFFAWPPVFLLVTGRLLDSARALLPLVVPFIALFFHFAGFWYEARKQRKMLTELLGEPENE